MTTPLQILFFIGSSLAPVGTHHITISAAAETYTWETEDHGWTAASTQVKPDGVPEDTLASNNIAPTGMKGGMDPLAQAHLAQHDWMAEPIIRFDEAHQLEKARDGYVYVVRPGDPSQKTYSITFCP